MNKGNSISWIFENSEFQNKNFNTNLWVSSGKVASSLSIKLSSACPHENLHDSYCQK